MKIGILGYGKMGREIFHAFFDQTKYDLQIVVFCRHDTEAHTAKVQKELDKGLRRKKFSEEIYRKKQTAFSFTTELSQLSDCDMIIESIAEQMEVKQELLQKLDSIVSEHCILASNTSSLVLEELFCKISHTERCLGIHFFYPVKLTEFVELNVLESTSDSVIHTAVDMANLLGKRSVIFSGAYHMYLNQFLSVAVSHGIWLLEQSQISFEQGTEIFSALFPMHGLFGLVDGIGLGLLQQSAQNFQLQRLHPLIAYSDHWIPLQIEKGCPTAPNTFLEYMKQIQPPSSYTEETAHAMQQSILSVLLNEAVSAMQETEYPDTVLDAVWDVVGLAEPASTLYEKYGYDQIQETLMKLYAKTGWSLYLPASQEAYDFYFRQKG